MMRFSLSKGTLSKTMLCVIVSLVLVALLASLALANDPTGAETLKKDPNAPVNFTWTMVCGFLVVFMMTGFAMVETGFTRATHANNTMLMNLMVWAFGTLGFFFVGFALMFGGVGGAYADLSKMLSITIGGKTWNLLGGTGFLLSGKAYDVSIFMLFLFQAAFMDTAATIPTGAMAERFKWSSFIVYGFLMGGIIYPIFGNWAWGGGWLSQLSQIGLGAGYKDFAGSGVVHAVGGVTALAGAIILGPRIGKFVKGKPVAMPGHDLGLGVIGTCILIFGWFGFNAGSTMAATDLRLAIVATNTMIAGAAGGLTAMLYMMKSTGKPDTSMSCNGVLAGLVAITAPCAYVPAWAAFLIGAIAGVLVCAAVWFVENVLKLDDPVGAVSVHGVNGMWGVLAVGLFADGSYGGVKGLLLNGDWGQFGAQLVALATLLVIIFPFAFLVLKILDWTMGLRVSAKDELAGLDMPVHGALCYPEFQFSSLAVTQTFPEENVKLAPIATPAKSVAKEA
ncbi:Amt family ammonium transporter [Hydrogenispora ethanolica]|uniref:Ammonium transporter n=2 Tax=Hydrogenispora ethanolica TaxID=1082276 RepID=A0A4R1QZB4_HYDET|nr:ammonium transporter [Hydrogenispora ethanolica]TCL58333.1 Amt family ammonium transporter [Hydrogenispora ethanolica]